MEIISYPVIKDLLLLALFIALSSIAYYLVKKYVLNWLHKLFLKTKTPWDQFLFEKGVFNALALIIPGIIMRQGVYFLTVLQAPITSALKILILVVILLTLDRLLTAGLEIYNTYPISHRMPIKGYVQIVKIVLYIFGTTIILSLLIGQSPWIFLSGLGALSAVLLLVFQDTILSFIAGIQLAMNDQIRVGDWIEMEKYGADGDVEEVALHTIKVRNWDKSITTIPTHKLVGDSFKNWRGMFELGGRRVKRHILIDQTSIKFCDEEMLQRFEKIQLLQDYIKQKREEIAKYNEEHNINPSSNVNGRHMTNIGTFRAYLSAYIRNHPLSNKDLVMVVRQLQPTTDGLPLEIYVFCNDVRWVHYEAFQADLFDHILAIIPEFDLRVFQNPSGYDLQRLIEAQTKNQQINNPSEN